MTDTELNAKVAEACGLQISVSYAPAYCRDAEKVLYISESSPFGTVIWNPVAYWHQAMWAAKQTGMLRMYSLK